MADHLQGLLRSDDVIGRVGGEEFAIFLPEATMETARQIGQRISMGLLVETGSGSSLHFTVSVGAASVGPHMTLDEALRDADIALYKAKTAGRARMEIAA
jgi:diguanylate cyclase (GGDEF)-like protein